MKKKWLILLSVILAVSLIGNVFLGIKLVLSKRDSFIVIDTPGANARDTYFEIHRIKKAHEYATGKGVKVGILDWGFGFKVHPTLYAGGKDFTNQTYNFEEVSEHGYWMTNVLKEIAPDCEVYALETFVPNQEEQWVDALIEAIDWAVENDLDILTLSHQMISEQNRDRLDEAVHKAVSAGLVTTFIHYDNEENLFPYGMFTELENGYHREPDVNILHYDYNTLFLTQYLEQEENGSTSRDTNQLYMSLSSTSPVTAGCVAILKELQPNLTPQQCKEILVNTSYEMEFEGDLVKHIVNMENAVAYVREN